MWALFTTMILSVHGGSSLGAAVLGLQMIVTAAALGVVVQRATERLPWPQPLQPHFALIHLVGALIYSASWIALNSVIASVIQHAMVLVVGPGVHAFLVTGVWIYVMVAGVSYATQATERAALADANAAKSQLAALRAQLNPHFLFNALHTVVHLIPRDPRQAALATERIGGLLRHTIEEDRDLVTLAEERAFVERYLDLERLRFGDRLVVHIDVSEDADDTLVPSFSLLTLVENAVRHGAEPNVDATEVTVTGVTDGSTLVLTVSDTGVGGSRNGNGDGTGLKRLRERLAVLYGDKARLAASNGSARGYTATLTIPRESA